MGSQKCYHKKLVYSNLNLKAFGVNTLVFLFVVLSGIRSYSQETVIPGNIIFEKKAYADPTLEINQDRITENVWLTRAQSKDLYNAKIEMEAGELSPLGTLWAHGDCQEREYLSFKSYKELTKECGGHKYMLNESLCLCLLEEGQYVNISIQSWQKGTEGGGYKYLRNSLDKNYIEITKREENDKTLH